MNPVLVHLHLPKCGGVTVGTVLSKYVGYDRCLGSDNPSKLSEFLTLSPQERDRRFDFLRGHYWKWGAHRLFGRDCLYVSSMREPIARVCSYFNYVHTRPVNGMHQLFKAELPSLDMLPDAGSPRILSALGPCFSSFYWSREPRDEDEYDWVERHVVNQVRLGRLRTGTLPVVAEQLRSMGVLTGDLPHLHETARTGFTDFEPASPGALASRTVDFLNRMHRYDRRLFEAVEAIGNDRPSGWDYAPWPGTKAARRRAPLAS